MAFYLHTNGKRGRPSRFEDRDAALITALIRTLDARKRVRGRRSNESYITVMERDGVIVVADTAADSLFSIVDSTVDKTAHKSTSKTVVKKAPTATTAPEPAPCTTTVKSRFNLPADVTAKLTGKISALTKEANDKKLSL